MLLKRLSVSGKPCGARVQSLRVTHIVAPGGGGGGACSRHEDLRVWSAVYVRQFCAHVSLCQGARPAEPAIWRPCCLRGKLPVLLYPAVPVAAPPVSSSDVFIFRRVITAFRLGWPWKPSCSELAGRVFRLGRPPVPESQTDCLTTQRPMSVATCSFIAPSDLHFVALGTHFVGHKTIFTLFAAILRGERQKEPTHDLGLWVCAVWNVGEQMYAKVPLPLGGSGSRWRA
jgi:hypothetical protein